MTGCQGGRCVSETIRVLIVEDLPADAELSEREIRKALGSCEFRRVETREGYVAALDEFRPALIVSDYRLPLFDGMTALKLAVERCPDVPFVVFTGSRNEDTAVECMKAGAWDYVIKGHVKRLGPAVQSALGRQRVRMERKRNDAALRAALARQEALLAAIPDIVMEVDANKIYTWANGPGIEFFGRDVVGRAAAFYFGGEQDTYGRVQPLFQGDERTFYVESWQRRRDGEKRLLAWWCRAIKDEAGNVTGALSTAHDITERERVEAALRESEARFRDSFEHSTIGNSLTGPDGRLLNVNQALADMLGFSIEELEQLTFVDITHPDDLAESRECVRSLSAGERMVYRTEKRYRHRDGHFVYADVSTTLLRDSKGALLCLLTNVVDISARKRAEEELAAAHSQLEQRVAERTGELSAANQELESFAYAVSHDLRAPLRGIDGWGQALLEECGPQLDEKGRKYLQMVRDETHRMDQLINDLLELSRVTRAPMTRETVDLTAMAHELDASLRARQPERAVDFVVAPNMVAEGDAALLRATLHNLLHNAWKFTGKRPRARIEVGCASEQGRKVYHVRDDGVGFDMRYVGKLFAPFQRLHGLDEFPGTGIGLAAVQRIVHRHGGKVWATAEVDQGATFYFTLTA